MPQFQMRTGTQAVEETGNALAQALNKWLTESGPSNPALCALYNTTPPAAVIVAGCPSHDDKEKIPF
jgi:hypothetical protein